MNGQRPAPIRIFALLMILVSTTHESRAARPLNEHDIGRKTRIVVVGDFGKVLRDVTWVPRDQDAVDRLNDVAARFKKQARDPNGFPDYVYSVNGVADPSLAYNVFVNNPENEPGQYSVSVEMPMTMRPGPKMVSAELTIDLQDTNNDGTASLVRERPHAFPGFQRAFIFEDDGGPISNPAWDLGLSDITTPGVHSFIMESQPGIVDPAADTLSLFLEFQLTPGDTVQLRGNVIIDDGSGVPIAQIPLLPHEGGGCQFISSINSPDTIVGDNERIGSCTHVNVGDGGQVGDLVRVGGPGSGFSAFDSVVNITGGTVGNSLQADLGGVVNISGGTIGDSLTANDGGVVNISGGTFGGFNRANEGGVINVSGGTFEALNAGSGGVVNVSGGSFLSNFLHALEGGVVNFTGGTVIGSRTVAHDGSHVNLLGKNFQLNGEPIPDLEPGKAFTIAERNVRLSGELIDGTSFDFELCTELCEAGVYQAGATITVTLGAPVLDGDFNANGVLDAADIDLLVAGSAFDLTGDAIVNQDDRAIWVENLANTFFGDANLDLAVDFQDFLRLADGFGKAGGWAEGDFDGSGDVQFPDFLLLAENFGQSASIASVPESSSMLFMWPFALLTLTQLRDGTSKRWPGRPVRPDYRSSASPASRSLMDERIARPTSSFRV